MEDSDNPTQRLMHLAVMDSSRAGGGAEDEDGDIRVPDFALLDQTLTMWSNVPTSFG